LPNCHADSERLQDPVLDPRILAVRDLDHVVVAGERLERLFELGVLVREAAREDLDREPMGCPDTKARTSN